VRRSAAPALAIVAAACAAPSANTSRAQPASNAVAPASPAAFAFSGQLTQGGWIRGRAPAGTVSAKLGDQALSLDPQGQFFAAFDRDAGPSALLTATLRDGRTVSAELAVSPRAWDIERVDTPLRPGGATPEEFTRRRQPELAAITAAKSRETGSEGWRQNFIWPAPGRISGRFGSQRIYRGGEAGAYHSGLDIAGGAGTTYVAPADGVVTLAAADAEFSLEGHLLIVDHGQGLNSAFLHASELLVREGDHVKQGQPLGKIGMTGRATGPHLHWSLTWRGRRLDPLLFVPPRP
jgi:murein DD-endopeptidase MepM/ murein hydrolase activator NlpD